MTGTGTLKLTYSTMFDPPPSLDERFDAAVTAAKSNLGRDYPMWIDGQARAAAATFCARSPIDRHWELGQFARGINGQAEVELKRCSVLSEAGLLGFAIGHRAILIAPAAENVEVL